MTKEKYGIELIGKGMWVWDDDITKAKFRMSVTGKTTYASDTNPNEPKQPKVGDIGYFWDDEESYLCSVLKNIVHDGRPAYYCSLGLWFTNFSKEKQPWMK
jgi:hypothetical protein